MDLYTYLLCEQARAKDVLRQNLRDQEQQYKVSVVCCMCVVCVLCVCVVCVGLHSCARLASLTTHITHHTHHTIHTLQHLEHDCNHYVGLLREAQQELAQMTNVKFEARKIQISLDSAGACVCTYIHICVYV
jgi:hypothetical protein